MGPQRAISIPFPVSFERSRILDAILILLIIRRFNATLLDYQMSR